MPAAEVTETITQVWPGWHVWVTRERRSIVATRIGRHQPVDDGVWARTVIADNWTELEQQLAEQAANDARVLPARTPQASGHNPRS